MMRKLIVFNSVSLDGYFTDPNGDMSWAYNPNHDEEWNVFVANNAKGAGTLLFGRITYEMMASYWPTPNAVKNDPIIAEGMNRAPKIVFSRTLDVALWSNTKLMKRDLVSEIRTLKNEPGNGIAILGSGSLVAQLGQARLIDEYQVVVTPVVLGRGRTMFDGIKDKLRLKLENSRTFRNGNVLLRYTPMAG